jgi:DNA-binding NarL/FixJ family response regulator
MTLSSVLLSRDWPEVSVLECILGSLHVKVDVATEPSQVQARLAKSKVDALIVDCDLEGTTEFLRGLKRDLNTVPLLVLGNPRSHQLRNKNAAFVFEKPISVEQAVHKLSAARNLILEGRLRYHRQPLGIPVHLSYGKGNRCIADLLNLSQGGVAVRTMAAMSLPRSVRASFKLKDNVRIQVKGEVVWAKPGDAGIRFVEMTPRKEQVLQLWLAKQYLTN